MKIKTVFWLFLSIFAFLLLGCADYRITATSGDYDKLKHAWEYCKKCLTEEDCPGRVSCEENTPEMITHAMGTALARGRLDTVRYIVEEIGFDVNTPLSEHQSTALHRTASYGGPQDIEIARYLISKGANINAISKTYFRTPLLTAIRKRITLLPDF
jgi:hypothetical protein